MSRRLRVLTSNERKRLGAAVEGYRSVDQLIADRAWDRAFAEAAKIQRLYPESLRVRNLEAHVRDAREDYKHTLERQFLEASQRDDIDRAIADLEAILAGGDEALASENQSLRATVAGIINL